MCGLALAAHLPALMLRGHQQLNRLWWRWRSRHRGGRRPIDPDLIALIRQISFDNPLWGAPRIHGELLKLGFRVAQSTVSKYMIPRRGRPTALWLAGEIARAFSDGEVPLFLIRDNEGAYGAVFRDELRAMGIRDRPTRPHSRWQNGHVERLIGSIRRECLDHCVIWNAAHLRRVLNDYAEYYNIHRTHLALGKDAPSVRAIEHAGRIASRPLVGGMHRRYYRK
jgi:putative transposase